MSGIAVEFSGALLELLKVLIIFEVLVLDILEVPLRNVVGHLGAFVFVVNEFLRLKQVSYEFHGLLSFGVLGFCCGFSELVFVDL